MIDSGRDGHLNIVVQVRRGVLGLTLVVVMLAASTVFMGSVEIAQETPVGSAQSVTSLAPPVLKVDTGDTAWVLIASALVLAMIMPGAGFVRPFSAMVIGVCAGLLCYFAVVWEGRMGYDDSLDVVGIHGVGGVAGILATGLFASKAINTSGADGLFFGHAAQFGIQAIMVAAVVLFAASGTWIVLKLVDAVVGLRVSPEDEVTGLDLSQHNERAYS